MNTNKLPKDLCYVLRMHMHVELHVQICAKFDKHMHGICAYVFHLSSMYVYVCILDKLSF